MKSFVVLALAGCYAPSIPSGAPCSDTEPCPRTQRCVASSCVLGDDDAGAGVDGPLVDGIADTIPADWWDPAWKYRRAIAITPNLSTTIASFPVLVRLDSQFDYANAAATGDDVRFTYRDEAVPFDIDTWSTSTTSTIWVSIPKLETPLTIWMYYGNPAATTAGTDAQVWADQTAVYHLNSYTDATGNGHGGATFGTAPSGVTGKISAGRSFGGAGGITLSNPAPFNFTTAMSLTMWARIDALSTNFETLVAKGNTTWRLHRADATNRLTFDTNTTGSTTDLLVGNHPFDDIGTWHHLAIVFDGAHKRFYVDGVLDAEKLYSTALPAADIPMGLGYNSAIATNRFFTGVLDEVRITSAAREAAWIATEYRTVVDTTFAVIGAAEHIE